MRFITLHDMLVSRKTRALGGKPIRVRASAVDILRGYDDGDVRCVVTIGGVHYHVAETSAQVESLVRSALNGRVL